MHTLEEHEKKWKAERRELEARFDEERLGMQLVHKEELSELEQKRRAEFDDHYLSVQQGEEQWSAQLAALTHQLSYQKDQAELAKADYETKLEAHMISEAAMQRHLLDLRSQKDELEAEMALLMYTANENMVEQEAQKEVLQSRIGELMNTMRQDKVNQEKLGKSIEVRLAQLAGQEDNHYNVEAELGSELEKFSAEVYQLRKQKEEWRSEKMVLEDSIRHLLSDTEIATDRLKESEVQIEHLHTRNLQIENSVIQLAQQRSGNATPRGQLREAATEMDELRESIKQLEESIVWLRSENKIVTSKFKKSQISIDELQAEKADMEYHMMEIMDTATDDVVQQEDQKDENRSQFEKLKCDLSASKAQQEALSNQILEQNVQFERERASFQSVQHESIARQAHDMSLQLQAQHVSYRHKHSTISTLQYSVEHAAVHLAHVLRNQLQEASDKEKSTAADVETELQCWDQQRASWNASREQYKGHIAALEKQMQQMRADFEIEREFFDQQQVTWNDRAIKLVGERDTAAKQLEQLKGKEEVYTITEAALRRDLEQLQVCCLYLNFICNLVR